MAWPGYFEFGGTEIINTARTERYLRNHGAPWFRPVYNSPDIHKVLNANQYRLPHLDEDTPWADANDDDSFGFFGVYPLSISGIENSSRSSSIIEFSESGGSGGRVRHGTKQIVSSALLIGRDGAAVDAGMRWLRNALLAGTSADCGDGQDYGTTLTYFADEPVYDDRFPDCADSLSRYLMQVSVVSGPTVTDRRTMSDGSAVWTVEWTYVAGQPYEYGNQEMVVAGFPDGPFERASGVLLPPTAALVPETSCPQPEWNPLFDPLCPDLVLPPSAPNIRFGCFTPPASWARRAFTIPETLIPTWSDMVPVIQVHTDNAPADLRNVRIRIYTGADTDAITNPCSFCADLLVSYVPMGGVLSVDGRDETVYFTSQGQRRRADSLIYGSDGSPLEWPTLTCGTDYLVVMDTEQTAVVPLIDFYLAPRSL